MSCVAHDEILACLVRARVPFATIEHPAVVTREDALTLVPELVPRLVTTIAFEVRGGAPVLVATRAGDRVRYRLLAAALGVNRRLLRLMAGSDIEAVLGFEVGGVGPFPVADGVRIVIDSAVAGAGSIVCGAGVKTRSLELSGTDLVRATGAVVAGIATEDGSTEGDSA